VGFSTLANPDSGDPLVRQTLPTGVLYRDRKTACRDGLHKALSKLWNRAFGPKPEITYTIVGPGTNARSEVFSDDFSAKSTRNDGEEVILLFPSATSLEDLSLAVERFIELMGKHYALAGTDPLTRAMALVPYLDHPHWPTLIYMNPETKSLELIDYVKSSQARELTTYKIPQ